MKKDFICIKNLGITEINNIFALTSKLKKDSKKFVTALKGKSIGLVFQKPSNRTRVSFAVGAWQLGAHCVYLGPQEINLGKRESTKDVAKTLSRYLDAIVARTFSHADLIELAKYATIPVINGLTDLLHPCQALADIYTIKEKFKKLKGINLAYVGDGNNVCHSLLYGCVKTGINLKVASPKGYEPDKKILKEAKEIASKYKTVISLFNEPKQAVEAADIVYTDVWTSMGEEDEAEKRRIVFHNFQVNKGLLAFAKKNCLVMHCLPAHRGEEITNDVLDSKNSIVFDQAENRLHVQKAILLMLIK